MIEHSPKKVAYIRVFAKVPIAYRVETMLSEAFPEFEIETITITSLLKSRPDILLFNVVQTLFVYGLQALANRNRLRRSFIATPFLFKRVKQLVASQLAKNRQDYAFTFQLQSLFDTSLPGLSHFVYTDHTHLANLEYETFNQSMFHAREWVVLEHQIYQNADLVFTRSNNITRSLVDQYGCPAEKVKCVYVGANVPIPEDPRKSKEYTNKEILFVGLDWERKGGPELLAAFDQVLTVHPDAHLTIIGSRPAITSANCRVLGKLPLEELQSYYADASIFCLPTRQEPFGVVFIEAMANHLPVVATTVGAIPDFVVNGENGYLVSPGDVASLARALVDLLDDPERCKLFGNRSYQLVEQRYNWQSVGRRIREEVYEQIQAPRAPVIP